jgi:lipopolysaccharide/colanic/teichoic acid biosynthesis glycosyltransferase
MESTMIRVFGLSVFPEMLALWVLEVSIGFLGFYTVLHGAPLLPSNRCVLLGSCGATLASSLLLAVTVGLVGVAIGLYRHETCQETRRLLLKAAISTLMSLPAVWLVAKVSRIDLPVSLGGYAVLPVEMLFAWAGLLLVTRLLYNTVLRTNLLVRRVVVLGATQATVSHIDTMASLRRGMFRVEVVEQVPTSAPLPEGMWHNGIWGVVYEGRQPPAGLPPGMRSFEAQSFWEHQFGRIDTAAAALHDDAAAIFAKAVAGTSTAAAAARRVMDIVLAVLLLVLTLPLLLVTALLIAVESPGPVLYRQERVGLDGQAFTIWKFRSMRNDAERGGPAWATLSDARVTRVGSFIRKVRIDELPQLVNILRGHMSLVGPRPERPHFVAQLAEAIPLFPERARVKPGLTGWAQVNYPYGASVEDARAKLSYDLYYVKNRSLLFDLVILLATVRVVLFQEGSR